MRDTIEDEGVHPIFELLPLESSSDPDRGVPTIPEPPLPPSGSLPFKEVLPVVLLNAVTILWGTQHAVIKFILDEGGCTPGMLNFARFGLAALVFAPWTPGLLAEPLPLPFSNLDLGRSEDDRFRDLNSSSLWPSSPAAVGMDFCDPSQSAASALPQLSAGADTCTSADAEAQPAAATTVAAWRAGSELGLWMFLGFGFQAVGLASTTASRSAFLLYLNVKFVPFFAWVFLGRAIPLVTWASAFAAFAGTALLSYDGTPPNTGDLWSVAAAATSAMFILRLEILLSGSCGSGGGMEASGSGVNVESGESAGRGNGSTGFAMQDGGRADEVGRRIGGGGGGGGRGVNPSQLNSANLWVTAALCAAWAGWELSTGVADTGAAADALARSWPLVAYLAIVTTALTNWIQVVGQRSVPAERASLIYAMDPVYAAAFARWFLGETLGPQGLLGAGLITTAALWNQNVDAPPPPPPPPPVHHQSSEREDAAAALLQGRLSQRDTTELPDDAVALQDEAGARVACRRRLDTER